MSFFDDLFNSSSLLPTEKVSEMLAIDLYWQIIENSLDTADSLTEQENNLIKELTLLTAEDIIGFKLRTEYLLYQSYQSDLWCAASIMNEECSEEGFKFFRLWLISQGKEIFTDAMMNTDHLSTYFDEGFNEDDLYEFEQFSLIPDKAFLLNFNQNIYKYIDVDNFKYIEDNYPKLEKNWDEENSATLQAICPKLYKIFIENISEYDDDDDDEEDRSDEFDIE